MTRPFADLVGDLVADARRAPVGDLELEALGFAMALEWAADDAAAEAAGVADALGARRGDPVAEALLRALALYAPGALGAAAAGVAIDGDAGPAADVGRFEVDSVWRAEGAGAVAHVAWLLRPGGGAQSFLLATTEHPRGAALLGGGMSTTARPDERDERLAHVGEALAVGAFEETRPSDLVGRLRGGAATNAALGVEVSVTLAMGVRLASHALAGAADAAGDVAWSADEEETDDDRAAFIGLLLGRAVGDGVDPGDAAALAAWRERFDELSPRAQLRALGLPDIPARGGAKGGARRADRQRRAKRKAARQARRRNR